MNRFNFYNIHNMPWLNVSIVAEDAATAIRRFNTIWGENVRYQMQEGEPLKAMQVLS